MTEKLDGPFSNIVGMKNTWRKTKPVGPWEDIKKRNGNFSRGIKLDHTNAILWNFLTVLSFEPKCSIEKKILRKLSPPKILYQSTTLKGPSCLEN